jgi:hypothetical protein
LFFNQFVHGIALDALAWKYYIFYYIFLAFEVGIVYFYIVETRYAFHRFTVGRSADLQGCRYTPMEEIAKFSDGKDAVNVGESALADVKERGIETGAIGERDMSTTRSDVANRA